MEFTKQFLEEQQELCMEAVSEGKSFDFTEIYDRSSKGIERLFKEGVQEGVDSGIDKEESERAIKAMFLSQFVELRNLLESVLLIKVDDIGISLLEYCNKIIEFVFKL